MKLTFMSISHLQNNSNLGPGQYEIKSFVDDWNTEHKKRTGRFFKMDQYPEKAIDRIYAFSLSQNPRNPVSSFPSMKPH